MKPTGDVAKKSKASRRKERKKKINLKWKTLQRASDDADVVGTAAGMLNTATTGGGLNKYAKESGPLEVSAELKEQPSNHPQLISSRQVVWNSKADLPPDLVKYWFQRFSLFHRFDKGIHIDATGWYSVTPEAIAKHTASRFTRSKQIHSVIDAFCGVGGNAIAFALQGLKVTAIEIDRVRLECARHNALIYGVDHLITFVHGDFMELVDSFQADSVFLSPPWGGVEYMKEKVFDIETMPINGVTIFEVARKISSNICYFLPRSVDHSQLEDLVPEDEILELEQVYLDDRVKCFNVYYGSGLTRNNRPHSH